jgi:hypothetical protein
MGTFRPEAQGGYMPPPENVRSELDRHTWLDLAGILLLLVGAFNIIDGIAAISDAKVMSNNVLFANLHAWGWFFLIVGVVQVLAGWAVMKNANWAAIVGIVTAFVNAVSQLSAAHTFTVWALTIVAMDVLVIYGLVKYGGGRGRTT